ncbi:type II toxin-antitoxin system VapC family toxin [Paraglaciecola sp. MB-3u-78]|jgi:PIN domain nuclease of toxin-antitoxin system|uniref:type II toxin-antitoxin system VapC family toxin n=1 Tax=Paraglaciecola sp. MB-3u-78 TaxID=2058332 RepID=UPI000C3324D2|nr:type II toxin-antitoxin system VapC family toxin [Paraglaciecola sp. MB-3u-78]PKG98097.1 twitching motility protein PilT [Paraglaciecola sp. MB-3u-78]
MILMDTCVIVWDALEPAQLTSKAVDAIDKADKHNALIVSDISIWEISMLIKKGRIEVATTAANFINLFLQSRNITVKSISPEIAELSVNFDSEINNDPADRIIAATSIIYNAQLITADKNLRNSELLDTVW